MHTRHAEHKILSANAVAAGFVDARLVAGDHSRLQSGRVLVETNILWSLVNTEEMSYTMAGAVQIGLALLPLIDACKSIKLAAASTHRELCPCNGKMSLEHKSVVVNLVGGGIAE